MGHLPCAAEKLCSLAQIPATREAPCFASLVGT